MLNCGLDFEYNEDTREAVVKNITDKTIYDIEMLFRVSYGRCHHIKCKYKKLRKIKAGETKRIKFREKDIKNIELMKYMPNGIKEYVKVFTLKCVTIILYIAAICVILFNSSSFKECISGLIFLTIFPLAILIMEWGSAV